MEEMKFEELTELKEPERLLESAMPFQKLIMQYQCALLEVKTKFEVLNHELSINSDQNPILSIESRIKKPISILEKMKRKNIEISVQAIEENICDIAGIRVICCFPKDIYTLAKKICEQDDIRLIERKDYIKNPKPNGYRSLHLILEVPVFFMNEKKPMKVEVQMRTIAMDFWASIEHKLYYKKQTDGFPVDTKEGLAIIKATEKENVKDIEKKINKLDTKDKLESQEASGEINYKSLFSSSVVMGDSISEAFTEYDLLNASSVVAKIGVELDELDDQIKTVADINPQVIFLSYGMNDVIATNGDTDLFIKEYKAVIDQLRKKLPDTTLYVNSIFPVSAAKQEEKPVFQKIPEYNAALQKMCDENQIAFLDNTSLVSDTYYEEDGIHFKADFYPIWLKRMAEVATL